MTRRLPADLLEDRRSGARRSATANGCVGEVGGGRIPAFRGREGGRRCERLVRAESNGIQRDRREDLVRGDVPPLGEDRRVGFRRLTRPVSQPLRARPERGGLDPGEQHRRPGRDVDQGKGDGGRYVQQLLHGVFTRRGSTSMVSFPRTLSSEKLQPGQANRRKEVIFSAASVRSRDTLLTSATVVISIRSPVRL